MNRSFTFLLAAFISTVVAAGSMPQIANAQDHINWQHDLEKAKQDAASEDKLILMHFSASWCAPCKEIERFVFVNPMAIRALSGQVVPVKVDVDLNSDIAEQFQVSSVPYDIIITPAGHIVSERSSPRSTDGYLQMIQNAQAASSNMSDKAVSDIRDLKNEMKRQQRTADDAKSIEKSYGALAQNKANQFKQTYKAPAGADVPKFENPKPWSQTAVNAPPAAANGVVRNRFTSNNSTFMPADNPAAHQPANPASNVQAPAVQAPTAPAFQNVASPRTTVAQNNSFQQEFQENKFRPANNRPTDSVASSSPAWKPAYEQPIQKPAPQRIVNPMAQSNINPEPPAPAASPALNGSERRVDHTTESRPYKLGLEGFCGVTLMDEQRWVKGDAKWGCLHRGRLYLFASEALRDQFQMSPDMYSPLLGGADPVAFHMSGDLQQGKRKHGVFYGEDDGPTVIVLFSNKENRAKFEEEPAEYLRSVRQAMSRVDQELLLR